MKDQHRATPEQWQAIEANGHLPTRSTILELLHRIKALEAAAQPPQSNYPEIPDGSLVDRVEDAIYRSPTTSRGLREEARAAIREVAAWIREQGRTQNALGWAMRLKREAER